MPDLDAFLAQQRHHHEWTPLTVEGSRVELERCECGALRKVEQPETD